MVFQMPMESFDPRCTLGVERLSAFAAKVKTPGNIAHKYYNDIVSTMRGNKEV